MAKVRSGLAGSVCGPVPKPNRFIFPGSKLEPVPSGSVWNRNQFNWSEPVPNRFRTSLKCEKCLAISKNLASFYRTDPKQLGFKSTHIFQSEPKNDVENTPNS